MLWKTPWKRNRVPVASVPVPMWFFTNFGSTGILPGSAYEFPAPSPSPGDAASPFWVGMIGAMDLAAAKLNNVSIHESLVSRGTPGSWSLRDAMASVGGLISFLEARASAAGTSFIQPVPQIGADIRAIVSLLTVEPDGLGNDILSFYVDGSLVLQQIGSYSPLPNLVRMRTVEQVGVVPQPYVHGWAGGNALPTVDEIKQWFFDSRYNMEIAAIPGKTSDRFSATSVQPTAPGVLPNLAGGQVMNYVVDTPPDPVAQNVLLNVTFAY
jgi:hypothetical protein